MKPTRNQLMAALLGTSLILAMGVVAAQDRGKDHRHGERMLERMSQRLDLDDAQRAEIQTIMEQSRPAMREHYHDMRHNRRELHRLMRDTDADIEVIRELAERQGGYTTELIMERAETTRAIRAVLTEEQQAKADRMMERRGKHRHQRQRGFY